MLMFSLNCSFVLGTIQPISVKSVLGNPFFYISPLLLISLLCLDLLFCTLEKVYIPQLNIEPEKRRKKWKCC